MNLYVAVGDFGIFLAVRLSELGIAGWLCVLENLLLELTGREHALLCDYARDKSGWGDVKGWIPARDPRSGNSMFANVRHFAIWPLLDDDVVAARDLEVDGRERGCDVERYTVMFGHDSNLVRADFVGSITIRSHSIGAHDNCADIATAEECSHHTVQDQGGRKLIVDQFERCESGTLVIWTCLSAINMFWNTRKISVEQIPKKYQINLIKNATTGKNERVTILEPI